MRTHRRHRPAAALAAAALLTGALTACGDDPEETLPPPASPEPTADSANDPAASLDPEDAEAAEKILAAFDSYMEGYIELSTEGVPGGTEETEARLEEVHISGEAYNHLAYELLTPNSRAGHATKGIITWDATVLEIDWDYTFEHHPDEVIPLSTLDVCFDESDWRTVDVVTGKTVTESKGRYRSTVTVSHSAQGVDY